jgi:hypothetical protein
MSSSGLGRVGSPNLRHGFGAPAAGWQAGSAGAGHPRTYDPVGGGGGGGGGHAVLRPAPRRRAGRSTGIVGPGRVRPRADTPGEAHVIPAWPLPRHPHVDHHLPPLRACRRRCHSRAVEARGCTGGRAGRGVSAVGPALLRVLLFTRVTPAVCIAAAAAASASALFPLPILLPLPLPLLPLPPPLIRRVGRGVASRGPDSRFRFCFLFLFRVASRGPTPPASPRRRNRRLASDAPASV